jgi:hypothetical protein
MIIKVIPVRTAMKTNRVANLPDGWHHIAGRGVNGSHFAGLDENSISRVERCGNSCLVFGNRLDFAGFCPLTITFVVKEGSVSSLSIVVVPTGNEAGNSKAFNSFAVGGIMGGGVWNHAATSFFTWRGRT